MLENDKALAEVEKTLHALDHVESPQYSPFFMTKLEARIAASQQQAGRIGWVDQLRWLWPSAGLSLLLLLNLVTVGLAINQFRQSAKPESSEVRQTLSQAYGLENVYASLFRDSIGR
jgi:hypothetical protein